MCRMRKRQSQDAWAKHKHGKRWNRGQHGDEWMGRKYGNDFPKFLLFKERNGDDEYYHEARNWDELNARKKSLNRDEWRGQRVMDTRPMRATSMDEDMDRIMGVRRRR